MSFDTVSPLMNGRPAGNGKAKDQLQAWNDRLSKIQENPKFHGDELLADKQIKLTGIWNDLFRILTPKNAPEVVKVAIKGFSGGGLDVRCRIYFSPQTD